MREKKWTDCPICGSKKTMRALKNRSQRFHPRGYSPLDISGLDGQFCKCCDDGFLSQKSHKRITQLLGEHKAKYDAERVVAAELVSVQEAAEKLKITAQGVHKMMREGRLRYVFVGGSRLPIRQDLVQRAKSASGYKRAKMAG